jgi:hypothetical protein
VHLKVDEQVAIDRVKAREDKNHGVDEHTVKNVASRIEWEALGQKISIDSNDIQAG